MPQPFYTVPHARPVAVGDRQLASLRSIAHAVPQMLATDAEAEYLLFAMGPLLDELATRRAWMAGHASRADLSNVVILPAVR